MTLYVERQEVETSPEVEQFMRNEWKSVNLENFGYDIPDSEWKYPLIIKAYMVNTSTKECELVGVAKCNIVGKTVRVPQLLVKTNYRKKKGIGTLILYEIEKICKERKLHKVRLSTSEKHQNIPFYLKNGFSIEATLHNDAFGLEWYILSKFIT